MQSCSAPCSSATGGAEQLFSPPLQNNVAALEQFTNEMIFLKILATKCEKAGFCLP